MAILKKVQELLVAEGFRLFQPSEELMDELAGLGEGERSGIYVHVMPGREYFYVGLSVDVRERYHQHLKTYGKIEMSTFLSAPEDKLGTLEMKFIALMQEHKVPLLNKLVPIDDFDSTSISEILDHKKQSAWLKDVNYRYEGGPREYTTENLRRYKERYDKFLAHSLYSPEAVRLAGEYIRRCMPEPIRTERNLWMINCLTRAYRGALKATALVRISVHRPEVLTVIVNDKKAKMEPVHVLFTISTLGLTQKEVDALTKTLNDLDKGVDIWHNAFSSPKFDHYRLTLYSYEDAWMVMESPAFVKACKSACIHLMHRGQVQPHFSQAHCLPLVQAALAATPAKVPKRKK
jgi:hypothetical protein